MLGDGLQERRHRLRRDRSADRACRAGTDVIIQIAELVDGGLELGGGDGLGSRRLLRGALRAGGAHTAQSTDDAKEQTES